MRQIFVNTNANSPATAVVRSNTNNQPAQIPDAVLNDTGSYAIFLVDGAGAFDVRSGDQALYELRAGVGAGGAVPSDGVWWACRNQQTLSIQHDATTDAVQQALRAFCTTTVTGVPPVYLVEFTGTAAAKAQDTIVCWGTNLFPDGGVYVAVIQEGDATRNEKQLLRVHRDPLTQMDAWRRHELRASDDTSSVGFGWTGTIPFTPFGCHIEVPSTDSVTRSLEIEIMEKKTGQRQSVAQQDITIMPQILYP